MGGGVGWSGLLGYAHFWVHFFLRITTAFQVWMWSKAKFVNRKFLMEEVYQQYQAEQSQDDVS